MEAENGVAGACGTRGSAASGAHLSLRKLLRVARVAVDDLASEPLLAALPLKAHLL